MRPPLLIWLVTLLPVFSGACSGASKAAAPADAGADHTRPVDGSVARTDATRADSDVVDSHVADSSQIPVDGGTPASTLLSYIRGLAGKSILSGQHADYYSDAGNAGEMAQVAQITAATGQTPAILGVAFSLANLTTHGDPVVLSNQWLARGGIVLGMFSPGNPADGGSVIGGVTQGSNATFGTILEAGTPESRNWYAGLDELKQLHGPILMRPFPEFNRNVQWWGSVSPPSEFQQVWRDMVTYIRGKGVNNVLWVFNLGGGAADSLPDAQVPGYVESYYPGSEYVDIVSMDSYPPSVDNTPTINALTALGKPVIYAEMGAVKGNPLPAEDAGNTSVALATIVENFPQVTAAVVWGSTLALPDQGGMREFMTNPKIINLAALPGDL